MSPGKTKPGPASRGEASGAGAAEPRRAPL